MCRCAYACVCADEFPVWVYVCHLCIMKPSYVYDYVCAMSTMRISNEVVKPHPVNSGREPWVLYVCMYACVYIIYMHKIINLMLV